MDIHVCDDGVSSTGLKGVETVVMDAALDDPRWRVESVNSQADSRILVLSFHDRIKDSSGYVHVILTETREINGG